MKKVNIYQIKEIGECKYAFMSWDYAKDYYNIEDYKLVASFDVNDDYFSLLDYIWHIGNNGELQKKFIMRSVSMSDIIEVDGVKYYVDTFGFEEIK